MRLATYNVEWFNALFDDDGVPFNDGKRSGRHGVTRAEQLQALGVVFTALDADGVVIVEAPDAGKDRRTLRTLEGFAAGFGLRARTAVMGFDNQTQQEIAFLYDPDVLTPTHAPLGKPTGKKGSGEAPRFDGTFRIDLDIDAKEDLVRFSKPPLELDVTTGDTRLRLIGVHVKSKAPHGARNERDAVRISIANRRKQLAQAIWLRERVDTHLEAGDALIVLGDFNDGPGLDEYEALFGRSAVEIVMGDTMEEARQLFDPHAREAAQGRFAARNATARFYQSHKGRYLSALLDYIMVSQDLRSKGPAWRIWHPFDDPMCYRIPELRAALLAASDHFPVTLDLDL